jgi:Fanconi anemia group I protein
MASESGDRELEKEAFRVCRDRLVKVSNEERQTSSLAKKTEKRNELRAIVVDFCKQQQNEEGLLATKARQLCHEIHGADNPPDLAYALFSALQNTPEEGESGRYGADGALNFEKSLFARYVFEELLLWVRDRSEESRGLNNMTLLAMNKGLDTIHEKYLPSVVDEIINTFDNANTDLVHLLELLPSAVGKLREARGTTTSGSGRSSSENADLPIWCSGGGNLDPDGFQTMLVDYICSLNWKSSQAASIVNALRDLDLRSEELTSLVKKILICCSDSELQSIIPLIYQLLLVSLKGKSEVALRGVAKLFEKLERKCWSNPTTSKATLLTIEGTVLLQMNIVAMQKHELAQKLLKSLKENALPLKPFLFGMLLSLARIGKCEKFIFDYLQDTVLVYYSKQVAVMPSKSWLQLNSSNDFCLAGLIKEMVSRSHHWDITIQSLLNLGKTLIKPTGISAKELNRTLSQGYEECQSPQLKRILLGVDILQRLFEGHDAVRSDVLKQCQQEILNNSSSSIFYIHLLARLCVNCKSAVLEHVNLVKECLDCFLILSRKVAIHFFISVLPLMVSEPNLKKYAMIVLRKAMFSRDYNHKLTAVKCLMQLALGDILPEFSATTGSHASYSQQSQSAIRSSIGEICHDLLGFLRKGLKQQYSLRKVLYAGLSELAIIKPDLGKRVVEMLLPHFQEFYEQDQTFQSPLKLERCSILVSSKFRPVEPLHNLISCIQNLIQLLDEQGKENFEMLSQKSKLSSLMVQDCQSLHQRMLNTNLEDFGIDKAMDLGISSPAGQVNLHNCYVLRGCIEAMLDMECLKMQNGVGRHQNNVKSLSSLFQLYDRLSNMLSGRPKAKAEKGGNSKLLTKNEFKVSQFFVEISENKVPHMSIDSLVFCLYALRRGEFPSEGPSTNGAEFDNTQSAGMKLARNPKFRLFVLQQCNAILETRIHEDNTYSQVVLACGGKAQKKPVIEHIVSLEGHGNWYKMGMPLFTTCETFVLAVCNMGSNMSSSQKPKSNQEDYVTLACVAIRNLISVVVSNTEFIEGFSGLDSSVGVDSIEGLGEIERSANLPPCVLLYIHLHKLLLDLVKAEIPKEAEVISDAIFTLCSRYPKDLGKAASHFACKICKEAQMTHPAFAKAMLRLALCFSSYSADIQFCIEMTNGIQSYIDSVSEGSQPSAHYGMINEKTITGMVQMILQHCSEVIDDVGWSISKFNNAGDDMISNRLMPILEVLSQYCILSLPLQ